MAERANDPQKLSWKDLPNDVLALIISHLGARDLARVSTVIRGLGAVQPSALNFAHTLTTSSKIGELLWGLKRSSRLLSAVIALECSSESFDEYLFELCPKELLQMWSFPCVQNLILDVRGFSLRPVRRNDLAKLASASHFGMSLLSRMVPQLQFLELKMYVIVPLPVMPRLRHLKIMLEGQSPLLFRKLVKSIAVLPALQTLYARIVKPDAPHPKLMCLDLRKCISLQAICLHGLIPKEVLLPPAAKLTVDVDACELPVRCHNLRLAGHGILAHLARAADLNMLSALSLHNVEDGHDANLHLGDRACRLQFLLVTCKSDSLHLILSLPCLTTLIVHATERLEFNFDFEIHAAMLDVVSIQWKHSRTMHTFEETLRAHCHKEVFDGMLGPQGDPYLVGVIPRHFLSTEKVDVSGDSGKLSPIHPCTVASGACGACLEYCCPRVHPVPKP